MLVDQMVPKNSFDTLDKSVGWAAVEQALRIDEEKGDGSFATYSGVKRDAVELKSYSKMHVGYAMSISAKPNLSEMITFVLKKLKFQVPLPTQQEESLFFSNCTNPNKKIGNVLDVSERYAIQLMIGLPTATIPVRQWNIWQSYTKCLMNF